MITRNIKCGACGHEGKVEAHDTIEVVPKSEIFLNLGKDSSTGFMHFQCPSCNEDLAVDPFKVLGSSQILGKPQSITAGIEQEKGKRHVPFIWGAVYILIALFILYRFDGWWTYIVCGVLAMLAWVSIKTALFASKKEIKELTSSGPVSEDTKNKFKERL